MPDGELLEIYTALRPIARRRPSSILGRRLDDGAAPAAAFVREAAAAYAGEASWPSSEKAFDHGQRRSTQGR